MYIPHGDYPKEHGAFNVIKMLPELFRKVELRDFTLTIGKRSGDFLSAQFFLYSSQYQSNYGAKLVMLLSAIERSNGTWKPLESVLRSNHLKKKIQDSKNGQDAFKVLDKEIEKYLDSFGSTRSVVSFFKDNLTLKQKQRLVRGISYAFVYKKQTIKNGTLYTPTTIKDREFNSETKRANYELGRRLKNVIYNMRSNFVHQASYSPFPDKKYLEDKKLFSYERFEGGEPKEQWIITISFESLYELTCSAFVKYWLREYKKLKKT